MTEYLFWIAWYNDGTCLPQFDPDSGAENLFKEVDESKLSKFGWYPFSEELAQKTGRVALPLPKYEVDLGDGDKLVAMRTHTIALSRNGETRGLEYKQGIEGKGIMYISYNGDVRMSYGEG